LESPRAAQPEEFWPNSAPFDTSSPAIGLLYAQALIEWGYFTAAERLLEAVGSGQPSAAVAAEVAGLKGRISKQRYVNGRNPGEPRYRSYLGQATRDYLRAYQNDPANYWHGINVVALMCRARRDGIADGMNRNALVGFGHSFGPRTARLLTKAPGLSG